MERGVSIPRPRWIIIIIYIIIHDFCGLVHSIGNMFIAAHIGRYPLFRRLQYP